MDKFFDIILATQDLGKKMVRLYHPRTWREKGLKWSLLLACFTLFIAFFILAQYWSIEPEPFDIDTVATQYAQVPTEKLVTGYRTTAALRETVRILLEKPGGYLSNDMFPPSVFLDNIPNWEFGVLVQVRDLSRSLRNDLSRSQTQSLENKFLAVAEPQFSFSNDSWVLPATESEYKKGMKQLDLYMAALMDPAQQQAEFFARADNLAEWLALVEKRLGNLSQHLSASVGQVRLNTNLTGEAAATQATSNAKSQLIRTHWLEIDDVFFESRGSVWALIQFLKAIEIDFNTILEKKNALVSLRQIIRELESTQQTIWSPIVMNGSGFGFTANYSLVMASYISRANAAVIDLRNLLING